MVGRWVVGPPGSGKTARAVAEVRAAAEAGRRVAWIGLPAQRPQVLRRLATQGPLLGVEFLGFQQLALLQLGRAGQLRPRVVGTARLALVAEALAEHAGVLPTPGEAQLFARAIAEGKRHGLGSPDLGAIAASLRGPDRPARGAAEVERLADVWSLYERLKGDAWDDDDVRAAAWAAAGAATIDELRPWLAVDVLVVDGWRDLQPGDLGWLRVLAAACDVVVTSVAEPPVGWLPPGWAVERLPAGGARVEVWAFANPVVEVRWVLRALARDLAEGRDPRDLAVVAPVGAGRALLALAPEFGVEMADEAPRALVDLPFGRLLVDLLELPEHPTATRLLAVPALGGLGRRAMAEGLSGREAIGRLAEETGAAGAWGDWLAALTPPSDVAGWARGLVTLAADLLPDASDAVVARAQEAALRRAQEAARLGGGAGFRGWWLALLRASTLRERARPGVALLEPLRVGGRRFRRLYLVGAVAGAYDLGEHEDYFVPEEGRVAWTTLVDAAWAGLRPDRWQPALPRRHRGLDGAWRQDLRHRADDVVITYAEGDRGGPLRPDARLVGAEDGGWGGRPPALPTASLLEAHEPRPFAAAAVTEPGGRATVETLRRAQACAFRAWASPLAESDPRAPWADRARRALTASGTWDETRRAALTTAFPGLAPWLTRHAAELAPLRFGVTLEGDGVAAHLDAVRRVAGGVWVVRFTLPDESPQDPLRPDRRWTELWAADLLRRRHRAAAGRVDLVAWPIGGSPELLTRDGIDGPAWTARLRRVRHEVARAQAAWAEGAPAPAPGPRCRGCPVADLCREGAAA